MATPTTATPSDDPFTPEDQLVLEIYCRDIAASTAFLTGLGFRVDRAEPHFVELRWGRSSIYLEQVTDAPGALDAALPNHGQVANVRVMVPDVDDAYRRAVARGCTILRGLQEQYYGLKDFTVAGPDGVGLRFATPLPQGRQPH